MKVTRGIPIGATLLGLALVGPATALGRLPSGELKLLPEDGSPDAWFGQSVAVHGSIALVGAPDDDPNGLGGGGSVYLFHSATGNYIAKLLPDDGDYYDSFGSSLSVSGNLALVGARNASIGSWGTVGTAYLIDIGTGEQQHKLVASDGWMNDRIGTSVSLSDGLALLGGPNYEGNPWRSGRAYIFDAATGIQLHKLVPQDGGEGDLFGGSVSISGDLALVGADADDPLGLNSGSAYLFDAATGAELHKLVPSDGAASDRFGSSVALSGGIALVGAPWDDDNGPGSGSVYVIDATLGAEIFKLTPADGAANDQFGCSIAISGTRALIGARGDDDNGAESGSAYLFDIVTGQELAKLVPANGNPGAAFGGSVSLADGLAMTGAKLDDDNGIESGSAYVFGGIDHSPGVGYCFGDPGSGTPCPCNNDNDGSVPGSGCSNGFFSSGGRLVGAGVASVSDDSLVLAAATLEPHNTGLYFQANGRVNGSDGIVFGDGLRCAGFGLIRLEIRTASAAGTSSTTIAIGEKGGVVAGDTKRYQCWYRTTAFPPCGYGVNDFNLTNGYEITWLP